MLMFPPVSVLVAPSLAVALMDVLLPMVSVGELISIFPAFPALLVSAEMLTPSVRVRFCVSTVMLPASPVPVVSTEILPSPEISIFSGALILIFPPLPLEMVEAEMKPWLLKLMSRSGLSL